MSKNDKTLLSEAITSRMMKLANVKKTLRENFITDRYLEEEEDEMDMEMDMGGGPAPEDEDAAPVGDEPEMGGEMGGDCLNTGCVPSKAFLRAAKAAQHGAVCDPPRPARACRPRSLSPSAVATRCVTAGIAVSSLPSIFAAQPMLTTLMPARLRKCSMVEPPP